MDARLAGWGRRIGNGQATDGPRAATRGAAALQWPACWGLGLVLGTLCASLYSHGLGRAYTYDESVTVGHFVNTGSLLDPLRLQIVNNNHPLLSFLDHVVVTLTGRHDEVAMRLVPLVAAAAGVAVLTAVCARRLGVLAGLAGGGLLGVNPFYAQEAQTARGYTLLLLAAIVATALLLDTDPRRWKTIVYVLAIAVGVATHVYMLPVVVCHALYLRAAGQLSWVWARRMIAGVVVGLVPVADVLTQTATGRGHAWHPELPGDIVDLMFPGAAALILVPLGLLGFRRSAARREVGVVLLGVFSLVAGMMVVVRPFDLYARFFCWLIPLAALSVAIAVREFRGATIGVAAAAAIILATQFSNYGVADTANIPAADFIDRAHAQGMRVCGVGDTMALDAYTTSFVTVHSVSDLASCDAAVAITLPWSRLSPDDEAAIRVRLPESTTYPAMFPATVYWRRPSAVVP